MNRPNKRTEESYRVIFKKKREKRTKNNRPHNTYQSETYSVKQRPTKTGEAKKIRRKRHQFQSSGEVTLEKISLFDENGQEVEDLVAGKAATIRCQFSAHKNIENVEIIVGFHTTDFIYIASMGTAHLETKPNLTKGMNSINCKIGHIPLTPGVFALRVGIFDQYRRSIFYGETLKIFLVKSERVLITQMDSMGVVDIPANWDFKVA